MRDHTELQLLTDDDHRFYIRSEPFDGPPIEVARSEAIRLYVEGFVVDELVDDFAVAIDHARSKEDATRFSSKRAKVTPAAKPGRWIASLVPGEDSLDLFLDEDGRWLLQNELTKEVKEISRSEAVALMIQTWCPAELRQDFSAAIVFARKFEAKAAKEKIQVRATAENVSEHIRRERRSGNRSFFRLSPSRESMPDRSELITLHLSPCEIRALQTIGRAHFNEGHRSSERILQVLTQFAMAYYNELRPRMDALAGKCVDEGVGQQELLHREINRSRADLEHEAEKQLGLKSN